LVEDSDGKFKTGEVVARDIESFDSDMEIAITKGFWCPPAALLYRRTIVRKIGGWNERLPVIQDARFLLDAAFHGGKFVRVPGIGAYYRVRSGESLSRRSQKAFVHDCFENALEIEDRWGGQENLNVKQRAALLEIFFYVARASYKDNQPLFESALRQIYELNPNWMPKSPRRIAIASKVLGYKKAEFLAAKYRVIKKVLCLGYERLPTAAGVRRRF
jgi:hypothetical protein